MQSSETGNVRVGRAIGAWLSEIATKGDLVRGSGLSSIQSNGMSGQSALVRQMEAGNSEARKRSALNSDTTTRVRTSNWREGSGARLSELQIGVIWCEGAFGAHL